MLDATADWLTDGRRTKPSRNESCDWLSSLLGRYKSDCQWWNVSCLSSNAKRRMSSA